MGLAKAWILVGRLVPVPAAMPDRRRPATYNSMRHVKPTGSFRFLLMMTSELGWNEEVSLDCTRCFKFISIK